MACAVAGEVVDAVTATVGLLRETYLTELATRPVRSAGCTACVLYGISDAFAQVGHPRHKPHPLQNGSC